MTLNYTLYYLQPKFEVIVNVNRASDLNQTCIYVLTLFVCILESGNREYFSIIPCNSDQKITTAPWITIVTLQNHMTSEVSILAGSSHTFL